MSRIHWFVRECNTSHITHSSRKELEHSDHPLNSVKSGEPYKNIPKPYKDKQGRSNQSLIRQVTSHQSPTSVRTG